MIDGPGATMPRAQRPPTGRIPDNQPEESGMKAKHLAVLSTLHASFSQWPLSSSHRSLQRCR